MPEAGDEEPCPGDAPPPAGREFMDLDLDLDASSWPFDPIATFVSSSPPPFLFSSSSPTQSLLQLSFPTPPSPLWLFEDRAFELSSSLASGNSDTTDGVVRRKDDSLDGVVRRKDDSLTGVLQWPAADNGFHGSCVIKERMGQALRFLKESTDQHVLVQVWAPVKIGDRFVLTTSGQPFVLDPQSTRLLQYRTVSVSYEFSVDEDSDYLGLPGRVFKQKLPEWTPNVQYYSSKEYPRLDHALHYDVQGTLALPVFEPSGQSCVGVVELIMTSSKIHYASEADKVCKALEAVNLKSSEILDHPNVQICNEGRQAALAEILGILTIVCEVHKLPLAQTWVPCKHRSVLADGGGLKKSCSSFDGSCMGQVCMSTTDVAFYIIDPHMWGFRDACVEHHLQKGQGVAGRAFESRKPCFSRDITHFCKTEYPLVHYARMFGLASSLAICLQSIQSGSDDYVLEFFLPPKCKDTSEQQVLLDSISIVMKQCFRSLKAISGLDLQGSLSLETIDMLADENHEVKSKLISSENCETHVHTSLETNNPEGLDDSQNEGNTFLDSQEQHLLSEVNAEKTGSGISSPVLGNKNNTILQRKRGKAEKSISLEVLQQYFSGSLKDAAKSLNVCPTTMKRICRQHGISRWPSRKINKVNRSLSKLKRVIESVQGAEGAFNLTTLTCSLPVTTGAISWPVNLGVKTQSKGGVEDKDSSPKITLETDDPHTQLVVQKEPVHHVTGSHLEPGKESDCSKSRSSSEGSMETPSQDSCQGNPAQEIDLGNPSSPELEKHGKGICGFLGLTMQLAGDLIMPPPPEVIAAELERPLGGMLIEDSGSSKDLRNICNSAVEAYWDESTTAPSEKPPQPTATQEPRTVTIKACYRDDIIRFRLSCTAGMVALKGEVTKRLKLEAGTFDINYLDDDHEWVILACDADLEECMEISRLSGAQVIRLTVHDIVANLGSSCESSGE